MAKVPHTTVTFRIPEPLRTRLVDYADARGLSMTAVLILAIESYTAPGERRKAGT